MGTLGCINDMLRRDKENRELRRISKDRLNDTRNRLIDLNKKGQPSNITLEKLEKNRAETLEKEIADSHLLFKSKLKMLGLILIIAFIAWIVFILFL